VARRTFADVVDAPAWRSPSSSSHAGSKFAGLARDQRGRPAVIESTVPLRTDEGAVDLRLDRSDDSYRPRNALVPVSLPARADGVARLADEDVGVQLAGAAPSEATVNVDKLFYADAWTDTDAVIVPQPGGMATTFLARSTTSPEDYGLTFDLPAGATLRLYGDGAAALQPGGAVIEGADGEVLARIAPPLAYDAQGTSVPTQLSTDGNRVVVHVSHRDRDVAYPILIDPAIIRDNYGADYAGTGRWNYWTYAQTQSFVHTVSESYIFVSGVTQNWLYWNNAHGTYVYTPPANSYVTQAQTRLIYHQPQSDYFVEGVYSDAIGDMENGQTTGLNGVLIRAGKAGAYESSVLSGQLRVGQASAPHYNNKVIVGIHMAGDAYRNSGMYAQVGGAIVWKSEAKPPTTSFLNGTSSWQRTLAPASVRSTDLGLGSRYVVLTVDGVAKPTADRCTSIARHQPCPLVADASFPYTVAEGVHTLDAYSQDLVGNAGAHVTQTVRYDATAPDLQLGGELYNRRLGDPAPDPVLKGQTYTIEVGALDGTTEPESDADLRAGVDSAKLEVRQDDGSWTELQSWTNPNTGDNAELESVAYDFDPETYALGQRAFRVTVRDRAGNEAQEQFSVDVQPKPVLPIGLTVTGEVRTPGVDDSGSVLWTAHIGARSWGAPLDYVTIDVDGAENDRLIGDEEECATACEVIEGDWTLDISTLTEGPHAIRVVAHAADGSERSDEWTIDVPGADHYAGKLTGWQTAVESQVGATDMPSPPDDWRDQGDCKADEEAMRACYDRVLAWGSAVQAWLSANLADPTAAATLPEAPKFDYAPGEVSRDLGVRLHDAFALAQRAVAEPGEPIPVAIGFHEPLTPEQVQDAVPEHADVQPTTVITGATDPVEGVKGTVEVPVADTLDASINDFYAHQSAMVGETIAELNSEQPEDEEDADSLVDALGEAQQFKAALDQREAFVTGVTVEIAPAETGTTMRAAARSAAPGEIKSIAPLPEVPDSTSAEAGTALAEMSVDAAAVEPPQIAALAAPKRPTCKQAGDNGVLSKHVTQPNPAYWAPSKHKADSVLSSLDGSHGLHLKEHRLRWWWNVPRSLAWMCSATPGQHNIEMEATVYPDKNARWSDNWESNSARKYTQGNLPGNIHQDDIATGNRSRGLDKAKYPDFSILAQSSDLWRYHKRYWVNFTTNEGKSDFGRVIYSAQPTYDVHLVGDVKGQFYCGVIHEGDYKSCMFSREQVCYSQRYIWEPPVKIKNDWSTQFPRKYQNLDPKKPRNRNLVQGEHDVIALGCDPRPAGWE
jgi:hypothetical protein